MEKQRALATQIAGRAVAGRPRVPPSGKQRRVDAPPRREPRVSACARRDRWSLIDFSPPHAWPPPVADDTLRQISTLAPDLSTLPDST